MADNEDIYFDEEEEEESSGSEDLSDEEDEEDTGLTENQNRLLYLISLYSHRSEGPDDPDEWVRKPALLVLLYEGIEANVLDYDYAPQSELIGNRRVYLNISQEGKSDIEFLREEELLNGLQISTKSYKPITCYQISDKGTELVKRVGRKDREAVGEFVYPRGSRELLNVEWDGINYYLKSESYSRRSKITEAEDVSYVSSAYVPQCLRMGGRPTLSNAHRAHESAISADSIRDELDEVITLNSVSIIVAEYIPFGANQIVQLNNNVGSTERVQGGFISPAIDEGDNEDTGIEMSPELTSVDILDYTLTNHINFEAEINFAEEEGVVQIETFGVSLNAEGTCFYGMQVEAVMDRIKDNISLDHLSRLLVDVQQDSSAIVDSIISAHQRELLQLVFLGDATHRNKVNLIISNEITPHLTAEEYMDKGEYENELKQVIGDTKAAYDISEHDTLIFGAYGLLVSGPNSRHHEPLLCAYLQFITIDIFLQNFFARLWILNDDMSTTYKIVEDASNDPRSLPVIRYRISKLAKDIILLEEILGYVAEALDIIEIPPEPAEQAGRSLYERLEIHGMRSQLVRRSTDMKKNIKGSMSLLDVIREMSNSISEEQTFSIQKGIEENAHELCKMQEAMRKSATSLWMILVVSVGLLISSLVSISAVPDLNPSDAFSLYIASIMTWFFAGAGVYYLYHRISKKNEGVATIRWAVRKKLLMDKFQQFIDTKQETVEEREYESKNHVVQISYYDMERKQEWGMTSPFITIAYDEVSHFMLSVTVRYNKRDANRRLAFDGSDVKEAIERELNSVGIWDEEGEDKSHLDLAFDKRMKLEELILAAEEDDNDDDDNDDA